MTIKRVSRSWRLPTDVLQLLQKLADKMSMTKSAVLITAIQDLAAKKGVK